MPRYAAPANSSDPTMIASQNHGGSKFSRAILASGTVITELANFRPAGRRLSSPFASFANDTKGEHKVRPYAASRGGVGAAAAGVAELVGPASPRARAASVCSGAAP